MATCPTCGAEMDDDRPLPPAGYEQGAAGADEIELIGMEPSSEPASATGAVSTGAVRRRGTSRRVMGVIVALAAVAGGLALVGRLSASGPGNRNVSPSTTATTLDTAPAGTDPGRPAANAATDTTITVVMPTTTTAAAGVDSSTRSTLARGNGPLLGRPVGWALYYGGQRGALHRVDLDTGDVVTYDGVEGAPLLVTGDRLVLATTSGPDTDGGDGDRGTTHLRFVPVSDPTATGATADLTGPLPAFRVSTVAPGPGQAVWVLQAVGDRITWQLIRTTDGRVIDEVPFGGIGTAGLVPGGGADVVSSGGGGLYRRVGHDYQLVTAGSPVMFSDGAALVRTCTSPTSCTSRWVAVDSGRPVDRPRPPVEGIAWQMMLSGGRYMLGWRLTVGSNLITATVAFDLKTGRLIEPEGSTPSFTAAATPDGRFLVFDSNTDAKLYDVERDHWATLSRSFGDQPLYAFVPNR